MAHIEDVCLLEAHEEIAWNVQWNPFGTILASCGGDKSIRLWGKEGRCPLHAFETLEPAIEIER